VPFTSTYMAMVNYSNFVQTINVEVQRQQPLNASLLFQEYLFIDVLQATPDKYTTIISDEYNIVTAVTRLITQT
jgi:hypothetical protein